MSPLKSIISKHYHFFPLVIAVLGFVTMVGVLGAGQLASVKGKYLHSSAASGSLTATPNPVKVCNNQPGSLLLSWETSGDGSYEIRKDDANYGTLLTTATTPSSFSTTITTTTNFYLVEKLTRTTYTYQWVNGWYKRIPVTTTVRNTIGFVTVGVNQSNCGIPVSTGSGTNVALASNGAVASASSTYGDGRFTVASVIDGDRGTSWATSQHPGWNDNTNNQYPDWVQVNFNGEKTISSINVFTLQDDKDLGSPITKDQIFTQWGVQDFTVQYQNNSTWTTIPNGSVTGNNKVWREFVFSPLTISTIRVNITKSSGGPAYGYSRLQEVEAIEYGTSSLVRTYKDGDVIYLETGATKIGLSLSWGGSITHYIHNSRELVNRHDPGREIQLSLYDGSDAYNDTNNFSDWGWNPVEAGDKYHRGSPVDRYEVGDDYLYVKTRPLHWGPENFGGNVQKTAESDVIMEKWIRLDKSDPNVIKVDYKITHIGQDKHYYSPQELPAVYVNREFDRLVSYAGSDPWASRSVSIVSPPINARTKNYSASEQWAAYVDAENYGLAVYFPGAYPLVAANMYSGPGGPMGDGTNYFTPFAIGTFDSGAIMNGSYYLFAGDYRDARTVFYKLHSMLDLSPDNLAPLGNIDYPVPDKILSGAIDVSGWAFDNSSLKSIEVMIDGVAQGFARYGSSRPDVINVYPFITSGNTGFSYRLDTKRLVNGPHTLIVKFVDINGQVSVLERKVNVYN